MAPRSARRFPEKLTPQFRQMLIDAAEIIPSGRPCARRRSAHRNLCRPAVRLRALRPHRIPNARHSSRPQRLRRQYDRTDGYRRRYGRSSHRLVHDVPDQFHWASGDIGPGRFDPRGPSGRPADHRPQPRGRKFLALASRFELAQPWFQDYPGLDKGATCGIADLVR